MAGFPQIGGYGSGISVNFNTTTYLALCGSTATASTTETQRQITYQTAGALSLFLVLISANTIATSATTIRTRVNAGNGAQSVSVGAGATGTFQDTTNSDAIAAGDEVTLQIVTPNTSGALTITNQDALFTGTSVTAIKLASRNGSTSTNNTTVYHALSGATALQITEANAQSKVQTAGTLKQLFCNVESNGRSTTCTVRSRVNTANGNMVISITGGTTGLLEDTSNTDTVAADDLCNYSFQTLGSGGTIAFGVVGAATLEGTDITACAGWNNAIAAGATVYGSIGGDGAAAAAPTTESQKASKALAAYTASRMTLNVSANGITTTSTWRLRKNSADGNQVISIALGATGQLQDTTNTDDFTASDTINYQLVVGAVGTTMQLRTQCLKLVSAVFPLVFDAGLVRQSLVPVAYQ